MECTFCQILQKKIDILYENDSFFFIYDKFPISPGNALIISKRHVVSLFDIKQEEWIILKKTLDAGIKIIKNTSFVNLYNDFIHNPLNETSVSFSKKMLKHVGINKKPDGYNIGINEGEAAGRSIAHFHFNIIPRYVGDMKGGQRGIKKIFSEFEHYQK